MTRDLRLEAFCSPTAPEVFHSVSHRHEIWKDDPVDVSSIHAEARDLFELLLSRATTPPGLDSGRILLLLGESGCGKTHLMRAFRNYAHERGLGYFGYMQMTSTVENYGQYVLSNLIDSLDKPYYERTGELSGLSRLSQRLLSAPGISPEKVALVRDAELDRDALNRCVYELADELVARPELVGVDLDLLRVLIYLQRDDPRIKARVLRYLRCDDLSPYDREFLGGLVPRSSPDDPQHLVELLGRLIAALDSSSLVLCLDQLEDIFNREEAEQHFRRAMSTICGLADQVPSSIVVISCLEDFYTQLRPSLTRSVVDRLEQDPVPAVLASRRTEVATELLVITRLEHFYEQMDVELEASEPTYPLGTLQEIRELARLRTRDVLDWCRGRRKAFVAAGGFPEQAEALPPTVEELGVASDATPSPAGAPSPEVIEFEQAWNDFRSSESVVPPEEDVDLASLLAWAIETCSDELETGHQLRAQSQGRMIEAQVVDPGAGPVEQILAGICNITSRGGHLGRQVDEVSKTAGQRTPVLVRSTSFPTNPKTKIAKTIGAFIAGGGRRVVAEDSEWRTILAMRAFRAEHQGRPGYLAWLKAERPLAQLNTLQHVLALDELKPLAQSTPKPAAPPPAPAAVPSATPTPTATPSPIQPTPSAPETLPAEMLLGTSGGLSRTPMQIAPAGLTRHAAFLGGTGSGKTTLALCLLEQLLERGVPAILVDRKGDLCSFADPRAWERPLGDPELERRRARLRERLDVVVYTPGDPRGRPLSISIVPPGFGALSEFEQGQVSRYAASSLVGMLGYKLTGKGKSFLAILTLSIKILGQLGEQVSLGNLITFVGDQDDRLLGEIGMIDRKLLTKLAQDLTTLRINSGALLSAEHPQLQFEHLLGRAEPRDPSKTRLSVVSTKFLQGNTTVLFWVAQLLIEALQWMSRNPSTELQAALMLDEADLYLPARGQPATKEPIESLLKRARSAGLSILLATQSPGDLDYKCRDNVNTWFLGRIKEPTAFAKLRPMLGEGGKDPSRLANQSPGEFHVVRAGAVQTLKGNMSLIAPDQVAEQEILALARQQGS